VYPYYRNDILQITWTSGSQRWVFLFPGGICQCLGTFLVVTSQGKGQGTAPCVSVTTVESPWCGLRASENLSGVQVASIWVMGWNSPIILVASHLQPACCAEQFPSWQAEALGDRVLWEGLCLG
jgi:hypothetical protein